MNPAGKDRNRQLVTVGIGTVLTLVMGAVLIAGFRLATQMRANITALQSASMLQTYPATMTQQFNALRDRLVVARLRGPGAGRPEGHRPALQH